VRPDDLERRLRKRLDALRPAPRAELLHVLMLPDLGRAEPLGHDVRKAILTECDTSSMFNIGPLEATIVVGIFLAIGLLIRSLVRR
jgi:hypothetical protein